VPIWAISLGGGLVTIGIASAVAFFLKKRKSNRYSLLHSSNDNPPGGDGHDMDHAPIPYGSLGQGY